MIMTKTNAILLLGPTGSGKTPLGQLIESRGLRGRRCVHFDFGENLRQIAESPEQHVLSDDELLVVQESLRTGALLENEHFVIAAKILAAFLAERNVAEEVRVVLNGLPRHVGQAADVEALVTISAVLSLQCSPQIVRQRIATNAGGDRTQRVDDDLDAIARKLDIYSQRTAPLIEHYRNQGARIVTIDVQVKTTSEDAWDEIERAK